ncbi:transcription initiation factor TFIID subunit 15 [Mercurialis annua]|uniref:transcription initiation factor TFIID subunit 15 n=1 Tax=Mercurialis annua TaxID=3986 RepID=UPI00215F6F28|nr:transcription initiation factor TFIID subunit 15 [Mercurialis annua]
MGSRDKDQTTSHHQPLLSSLVVRPSVSDGPDGVRGGGGAGSDYEPGEVRREPPPYSRSDRYSDDPGYRIHAGSASPPRRRDTDHRYHSDFDHSGGPPRGREFGSWRDPGRFRDSSPPYARGRIGGRPPGRGFDGPGFGPGTLRGEGMSRNNPNVRPREGDWICSDIVCNNLNFARREFCNNCKKPRYGPGGSPRRGHPAPTPLHASRRFPGPPLDLSPGRSMNGYRSPPRGWARDGPRDFGPGGPPPPRHGGRFSDNDMRRGRADFPDDEYRGRNKFDRPMPMDWGHRDRARDAFNDRKGFERRLPSPPGPQPLTVAPQRGRWVRDARERSRSPIRGAPPPKEYRRDMYMERGRDDRRGMGRDRMGDVY